MKNLVLYHANCNDGFAAAYAASQVLPADETEYRAVNYHDDPPTPAEVAGLNVYVLDFSYSPAVVEGWAGVATLVMLDHHATMAEAWGFDVGDDRQQQRTQGNALIRYRSNQSGAVMAWHYFSTMAEWTGQEIPALFAYVQDRDLWRFELPDSKAINAVLGTLAHTFLKWSRMELDLGRHHPARANIVHTGKALLAAQHQRVLRMAKNATLGQIGEHPVVFCNASTTISELGNHLAKLHPERVAVIWFYDGSVVRLSFRSVGDVSAKAVAELFGGGGHLNAAGATVNTLHRWCAFAEATWAEE